MFKEKINEYFVANQDALVQDVCRLIRIKSEREEPTEGKPYGEGPAAVLAEALKMASEMGFKVKNYDNYVGAIDMNDMEQQLDILAHLDVVPAGDGWTKTSPYVPAVEDGNIYGRGTADDKGPAVAALYAMKAVKDLGMPLNKNVRLILGTDEECGSSDIKYYYGMEKEAPMTFSPDGAFPVINIEKGGLNSSFESSWETDEKLPKILSMKCGIKSNVIPDRAVSIVAGFDTEKVRRIADEVSKETNITYELSETGDKLQITALGKGAHSSKPAEGNNALTGMMSLLCKLPAADSVGFERLKAVNEIFPHGDWGGCAAGVNMSDELSGELTISFNIFEYGQNGLKGVIDSRAPICANNSNMRDVIKDKLNAGGIQLEDKDMYAPHHVSADTDFVRTLLRCYEDYTGLEGKAIAIGGGTYVHSLKNGVAFGCTMPGTDNHLHGADEFMSVEDLILSAKIFAQVIVDLCS